MGKDKRNVANVVKGLGRSFQDNYVFAANADGMLVLAGSGRY